MATPDGFMRNIFLRLYCACFETRLIVTHQDRLLLKNKSVAQGGAYIVLTWDPSDGHRPEATMCISNDEELFELSFPRGGDPLLILADCRYWMNARQMIRNFTFLMRHEFSIRDAKVAFEMLCVTVAAHEIRHELQNRRIVLPEERYTTLPKLTEDIYITDTRVLDYGDISRSYRKGLISYAKRNENDRENLADELDALSIELLATLSWAQTRKQPFGERLLAIRDIVFSTPGNCPILKPHPSG